MVETEEQLAREWGESLRRATERAPRDAESAQSLARGTALFVELLSAIWGGMIARARRGGAPAGGHLRQSDLLLSMTAGPDEALWRIAQWCDAGAFPDDVTAALRRDVGAARQRLAALTEDVRRVRAFVAAARPSSVSREEVERLAREADEQGSWLPLSEDVARLRPPGRG